MDRISQAPMTDSLQDSSHFGTVVKKYTSQWGTDQTMKRRDDTFVSLCFTVHIKMMMKHLYDMPFIEIVYLSGQFQHIEILFVFILDLLKTSFTVSRETFVLKDNNAQ